MRATLERSAYVSGEHIRVKAEIQNGNDEQVWLHCKFVQVRCSQFYLCHYNVPIIQCVTMSNFQTRILNIVLSISLNMCFGCSKEPSYKSCLVNRTRNYNASLKLSKT